MALSKEKIKKVLPNRVIRFLARAKRWPESVRAYWNFGVSLERTLPPQFKIGMAVLAYERPDYLELCLDSLFRTNLYNYDITFLIIDDGSKDPKVRELIERSRDAKYKIHRVFTPKGPNSAGAAINKAIKALMEVGDFDIIGWSDPDALYHPEWLHQTMQICLWAKKHHRLHKLGPFSSFHSSDYLFHRILGTYSSPYGNYVVKRQMGMLNYFYFKKDFLKLGFFDESPDDETLMTDRFEKLGVRNFCTETSYIEHLGQHSILNQWRPTPVRRAVFGLNLIRNGWEQYDFERLSPFGYYRYLQKPMTFGYEAIQSEGKVIFQEPIDVLITALESELEPLEKSVHSIRKNLLHQIDRISIVSPPSQKMIDFCKAHKCEFVDENLVLPIKVRDIRLNIDGTDRRGWLFQQLIKLNADRISNKKFVYNLDADTVLTQPQYFVDHTGKTTLLVSDEYHAPYFDTFYRIFKQAASARFSFISHQMVFSTQRLKEFRTDIEKNNAGKLWYQAILDSVDYSQVSSFSEYETYGNWMLSHHPQEVRMEYWYNQHFSRSELHHFDRCLESSQSEFRSISFHSYIK